MFWLYANEDVRAAGTERLSGLAPTRVVILSGFDCSQSARSGGLTANFVRRRLLPSASPPCGHQQIDSKLLLVTKNSESGHSQENVVKAIHRLVRMQTAWCVTWSPPKTQACPTGSTLRGCLLALTASVTVTAARGLVAASHRRPTCAGSPILALAGQPTGKSRSGSGSSELCPRSL
jgi:hypothetical protein